MNPESFLSNFRGSYQNRHAPICRFCLVLVLWVCYCPRLVTIQSLHPLTIR